MKSYTDLQEGLYDPNIFKAFFLAGGPGSGKSYVVKKSTGGTGMKIVNSDDVFEKYLKQAIQLMPNDPIVNDHYGDILWKLDRKLQARYFWESILNFKTTEDDMKKSILKKLLKGPKET